MSTQITNQDSAQTNAALRGMVPVREGESRHFRADNATAKADLARRISSSQQIARMREPFLLNSQQLAERRLMGSDVIDSEAGKSFRSLRARVFEHTEGRGVIMVTSVVPSGGASFVAANLATAIALEESSTALVVDCNRQKMSGQQTFSWPDVQETPVGLAAYIRSEKVSTEDIIRPTGIPRLRRIAMGDSRGISGECFSTVRMRGLIQELSNRYTDRYIILDAPSPVATGDVGVLAEFCDWVILVVPYGGGTSQQINEAAAIVGPNRVLGCVFNHCPRWPAAPV